MIEKNILKKLKGWGNEQKRAQMVLNKSTKESKFFDNQSKNKKLGGFAQESFLEG
jgi:hypothetical protein